MHTEREVLAEAPFFFLGFALVELAATVRRYRKQIGLYP